MASSIPHLDIDKHTEMLKNRKEKVIVQAVGFKREDEIEMKLLELALKNNVSFSNFVKGLIYEYYKDQLERG